MIIIIL